MAVAIKQVVRRFFDEVWNDHNAEFIRELCATNLVVEDVAQPEPIRGIDQNIRVMQGYLAAFPDIRFKVLQQLEEGDRVVTLFSASGMHKGPFMGTPATNRRFSNVEGIQIDQVQNGKIVYTKAIWDVMGLQRQLGLLPEAKPEIKMAGQPEQKRQPTM